MSNDPYQSEPVPYPSSQGSSPYDQQGQSPYPQSGQVPYPPPPPGQPDHTIYPEQSSPPYTYPPQYEYSAASAPMPYPAPQYGGAPLPTPPRKRRRTGIILGIVGLIVLLIVAGVITFVVVLNHSPATGAVNNYYTALENQNYAQAYSYLSPNLKLNSNQQLLTQELFVRGSQQIDAQKGKISKYTITSTSLNSNNGVNTGQYVLKVTRSGSPYDVSLSLRDEGGQWKIIAFSTI